MTYRKALITESVGSIGVPGRGKSGTHHDHDYCRISNALNCCWQRLDIPIQSSVTCLFFSVFLMI